MTMAGIQLYAQNEFAAFIRELDMLKATELKRTEIRERLMPEQRQARRRPRTAYYVPDTAVEKYIRMFDRLTCTRENAVIRCYYRDESMGGQPYLVATDIPLDSVAKKEENFFSWLKENRATRFMVPVEDTPMAYFQHLVFQVYGEQFALYWHALYGMHDILLKHPGENGLFYEGKIVDEDLNARAKQEGMAPVVDMTDDHCIITLYEDNHEAVQQVTYRISRRAPWAIEQVQAKTLIEKPVIMY